MNAGDDEAVDQDSSGVRDERGAEMINIKWKSEHRVTEEGFPKYSQNVLYLSQNVLYFPRPEE